MGAPDVLSPDTLRLITSKAEADAAFRGRLLAAPLEALASLGIRLPEGLTVRFLQDSAGTRHFVLPQPPGNELSDEDLGKAAGGFGNPFGGKQLGGGQQLGGGAQLGGGQQLGGGAQLGGGQQLGGGAQLGGGLNTLNKQQR